MTRFDCVVASLCAAVLVVALSAAPGPTQAGVNDAQAAFAKREQSFAEVKSEAEQGLIEAQRQAWFRYAVGRGVARDDVWAVYWARRGAHQGDWASQFYLGKAYLFGRGVPQSDVGAYFWSLSGLKRRRPGSPRP